MRRKGVKLMQYLAILKFSTTKIRLGYWNILGMKRPDIPLQMNNKNFRNVRKNHVMDKYADRAMVMNSEVLRGNENIHTVHNTTHLTLHNISANVGVKV
jgi:hypothetical protein